MSTKILNFGHPLSETAQNQLLEAVGEFEIHNIPTKLDMNQPLDAQVRKIISDWAESAQFTADDWQTKRFLVNLPGMSLAAALVIAEIAGRAGYLPRIIQLKQNADGVFELAGLIALNAVRNEARNLR